MNNYNVHPLIQAAQSVFAPCTQPCRSKFTQRNIGILYPQDNWVRTQYQTHVILEASQRHVLRIHVRAQLTARSKQTSVHNIACDFRKLLTRGPGASTLDLPT